MSVYFSSLYFGIKGYEQKFLFQMVGKTLNISASEWGENESPASELVLIGTELDKDSIKKQLLELVDPNPDSIQDSDMVNFERFFNPE